jgi:pilus assembly protein CpaB
MKEKIIPLVSVIVGILAFVLTAQYLGGKRRELDKLRDDIYKGAQKIRVVAAGRDIPGGTAIAMDDLGAISVFESQVRGHAVTPEQANLLVGRKTLFTIKTKEPVFWSDIEGGAVADAGLSPIVTPGMRALSLSVGGPAALSGMLKPNDRVDVLGTFSFPSKDAPDQMETVTLTVLQDVTLLAIGQTLAKQQFDAGRAERPSPYTSVTVEITPREAELLVFAQQMKGQLVLTLRNPSDISFEENLPRVDFKQIESSLSDLNRFRQQNIRHKKKDR